MEAVGGGPNPFQINNTLNKGLVTVNNPLDAETLPGLTYAVGHVTECIAGCMVDIIFLQLTVIVEDKGLPLMSNSTSLVVMVMDVNDEAPLFSQATYRYRVEQTSTLIIILLHLTQCCCERGCKLLPLPCLSLIH